MKILRKQTLDNGKEKSMSSQEGFLVNLSPLQVKERERMITVTSGRTCSVLYGKSDPLGLLVKTLLESSRWFSPAKRLKWEAKPLFSEKITEKEYCYDKNTSSKPSVKTLSEKDIPSSRLLFRLVPSERPTGGIECGLLPTVQTQGLKQCNKQGKTEFVPLELLPTPNAMEGAKYTTKLNPNSQNGKGLTALAVNGMLPTPMASDATTGAIIGENDTFIVTKNGTPRKINQNGQNGSVGLGRIVQMLPTPTASCHYTGTEKCRKDGRPRDSQLNHLISKRTGKPSQLNPLFVEEMMGFPLMWTTLPFLSQNGDKNQLKDMETP